MPHGNRRFGPDIVLKEDGYVIREDERPDHVIARDKARRAAERAAAGAAAGGASSSGGGGASAGVAVGKYEECWVCGETTHRRSDCPNKGFAGADRHEVQRKLVCLGCRRKGHVLRDCPDAGGGSGGALGGAGSFTSSCYNCGSSSHAIHTCPEPKIGTGFGFASCFVCHSTGHLSRDCPRNAAHGLYPRGGGCKRCGSTVHLVRDCPSEGGAERPAEAPAAAAPSRRARAPQPAASDEANVAGNAELGAGSGEEEEGGGGKRRKGGARKFTGAR